MCSAVDELPRRMDERGGEQRGEGRGRGDSRGWLQPPDTNAHIRTGAQEKKSGELSLLLLTPTTHPRLRPRAPQQDFISHGARFTPLTRPLAVHAGHLFFWLKKYRLLRPQTLFSRRRGCGDYPAVADQCPFPKRTRGRRGPDRQIRRWDR